MSTLLTCEKEQHRDKMDPDLFLMPSKLPTLPVPEPCRWLNVWTCLLLRHQFDPPIPLWLAHNLRQGSKPESPIETSDGIWESLTISSLETLFWLHLLKWPWNLFLLILTMPTGLETDGTTISANWKPSESLKALLSCTRPHFPFFC